MLTRLKVSGFKNLLDVDIRFGPFTCIAGPNGVGKSNLMDAIRFLSLLASESLMDAALAIRESGGRGGDVRNLFYNFGHQTSPRMNFEVEMIVPPVATDDFGQTATASITFLRYSLSLGWKPSNSNGRHGPDRLLILREELTHIPLGDAKSHLRFPHKMPWRKSVITGARRVPYLISTEEEERRIKIHQDGGSSGRPLTISADNLPRTVLAATNNASDRNTVVAARREVQSWRQLQLEPSALRRPDEFRDPQILSQNGKHMPGTLFRLANMEGSEWVCSQLANRLSELVGNVQNIEVHRDEAKELLTLYLTQRDGTRLPAGALSDGTLRFLALSILELDPESTGLICLEEPENGIHPNRIPAMIELLSDLAVDPNSAEEANPLRQVIVNTHSPLVVKQCPEDAVVFAHTLNVPASHGRGYVLGLACLPGTWRAVAGMDTVGLGTVVNYLEPVLRETAPGSPRRVIDRQDLQMALSFAPDEQEK